jgi:hypothetical protein
MACVEHDLELESGVIDRSRATNESVYSVFALMTLGMILQILMRTDKKTSKRI